MAIYKNITVRGSFVYRKDGNTFFSGKNEDGKNIAIRLLEKEKDEFGNYLRINKNKLSKQLGISINDGVETYIEKNKNLTPEQAKNIREGTHVKLDEILNSKKCFVNFSSANGMYNRVTKTLMLDSFVESIDMDNGNFHSIKLTEFKKGYGRDQLPIQVDMKYKDQNGYTKNLKVGDIGKVPPENIIFIAKPLIPFMSNEDVDYLFDINQNNIAYKYKFIKEKGETPTFQNPHFANETSNITPQLKVSVPKSVLRHVGGEYKVLEDIFKITENKFQVPLSIDGESVRIDGSNLSKFQKSRDVIGACFTHTLNSCANSYAKLFGLLKASAEAIEEAKQVDKFNKIISKMNNETNPNQYYKSLDKLKDLIYKTGIENSPINISTFLSTTDSIKKLKNDPEYKAGYQNSIKKQTNGIVNTVKQNIITQLKIFSASETLSGKSVMKNILERVKPVYDDNKKIVDIDFKVDEKGKTILDYINVQVSGQVPVLKGSQKYPPISLKGMIQNNNIFVPFANRMESGYNMDSNRLFSLLGIPTVISPKRRNVKIDVANDTSEKLVKDNRGRKAGAQKESQNKQNQVSTIDAESQQKVELNAPQEKIQEEDKQEIKTPSSFDVASDVEASAVQAEELKTEEKALSIGIDESEVMSWLEEEAPDAGKAEQMASMPASIF